MKLTSTHPLPGFYQYTYHTFVDAPQQICIHCLTPDQQKAFVSYPNHPTRKAAQLVDISWFDSVTLVKLDGRPQLMHFLDVILPEWINQDLTKVNSLNPLATKRFEYGLNELIVAFG